VTDVRPVLPPRLGGGVDREDGEGAVSPVSVVGGDAELETGKIGDEQGEENDDDMQSELHGGSKGHAVRGGGDSTGDATGGFDGRSGVSWNDTKRRDREERSSADSVERHTGRHVRAVHGSGSGDIGGVGLVVGGELKGDVHCVDGGGSSARSNFRSTSGDATLLSSLGLVGLAVTVKVTFLAAVTAGPKLFGPFEVSNPDVGDPTAVLLLAASSASRRCIGIRIVTILVLPILGGVRFRGTVVHDGEAARGGANVLMVANATTLTARLCAVDDDANH
jgi:hypothetical protein